MNWFQTAHELLETFYDIEGRISGDDGRQRSIRAIDAFHELFLELASTLKLRDQWPNPHCDIAPGQIGIIERSAKMQVDFTLGTSLYGWYIEAWLANADQIRFMRDDFWHHLAHLSVTGKAELENDTSMNCGDPSNVRKLLQHKGSLVFAVARDYTLASATPEADCIGFLGKIRLTLPVDSAEQQVMTFFREGLEALYRVNYLLYRSGQIQRSRINKKVAARIAAYPSP